MPARSWRARRPEWIWGSPRNSHLSGQPTNVFLAGSYVCFSIISSRLFDVFECSATLSVTALRYVVYPELSLLGHY